MKTVFKAVACLAIAHCAYGAENAVINDEKDAPLPQPTLLSLTTLIKPTIKKPAAQITYEDNLSYFQAEKKKLDSLLTIELKTTPNFKEIMLLGAALMRDCEYDNYSNQTIKKDLRLLYKKIIPSDRAEFKKQGYGIFDDLSDSEEQLKNDDLVYKKKIQKLANNNTIESIKQSVQSIDNEINKKEQQILYARKETEDFEKEVKAQREQLTKKMLSLKEEQTKLLEKKCSDLHTRDLVTCINSELTKDQDAQIEEITEAITETEKKLQNIATEQESLNSSLNKEFNADKRLRLLSSLDKKQEEIKKLSTEIQELRVSREKMESRKKATDYSFSDWARFLTGAGTAKK